MNSSHTDVCPHPEVMAIVNMTPDSFFGGSRCADSLSASRRVEQCIAEGADIIDIGGFSTRPGADDVDEAEEWRRVELGLRAVREVSPDIAISVDTFRSGIVRRAYDLVGNIIVNDISASAGDPELQGYVVELDIPVVIMHMRGNPLSMQHLCQYDDIACEVEQYLLCRAGEYERKGVRSANIILDPGFGFAKSVGQNYELLSSLRSLAGHGYRVLAGVSRKSMITVPLGITPEDAEIPTGMVEWELLRQGASIIRTHDVRKAVQAVRLSELYDRSSRRIQEIR